MRLDGDRSQSGARDPANVLPKHFASSYPNLVEFLEAYVDTLYKRGIRPDQVQAFLNDESWWAGKDATYSSPEERLYYKTLALQKERARFGFQQDAVEIIEDKSLFRGFSGLQTLDNFILGTFDGRELTVPQENSFHIQSWLGDKGLGSMGASPMGADLETIIKLAKHLFRVRGSLFCAKVFFEAVYGGTVYPVLPRHQISALDNNFVLDGETRLRDDYEFDEFTYVINLVGSKYDTSGDKFFRIWKDKFHPGGFRCIFRVYSEYEWIIVSNDAMKLPPMIEVWKEFFEGPFAIAMRGIDNVN